MHPLDRPVWASLSTCHADLSLGDSLARRYRPEVNLFASPSADTSAGMSALEALVKPGERVFVLQVPEIRVPTELLTVKRAKGVQLVANGKAKMDAQAHEYQLVKLTDADAPEMLELTALTEPGPFLARTHTMGCFLGIRIDDRLAAMAGERFRFPGYTEVSGVCTHPDFRGRGLARFLSTAVAGNIEARGDRPFLHAWTSNQAAISLYRSLGFELRTEVHVAVFERQEG